MIFGGDDDEPEDGTEGEGTEEQGNGGGQQEADLPTEQPDVEEDDGEQEVVDGAAEKPSRAEARFQRLANETKAAREEAAAARREADELRRAQAQGQQRQTEQQEREMLALMTPDEKADYKIQQFERRQHAERQQDRMSTASMMDKAAFDAKATVNPVYQRHRETVEEMFQDQVRQGKPVEREILLQLHLGKLALAGARNPKAKQAAKGRVESQRVAPGGGKGDAASNRGKAGDSAASRLKDVFI